MHSLQQKEQNRPISAVQFGRKYDRAAKNAVKVTVGNYGNKNYYISSIIIYGDKNDKLMRVAYHGPIN